MINSYLSVEQIKLVDRYYTLILDWNKTHNLTRIVDKSDFIIRNVIDTAVIYPYLSQLDVKDAIDVGTGAGIPGVILAIMMPAVHWHLVDASLKRITFLEEVKYELNLDISLHHCRIEDFDHVKPDLLVTRAVSDPDMFLRITKNHHHDDLIIAMMRSKMWHKPLNHSNWLHKQIELNIPDLKIDRSLMLLYQNTGAIPEFSLE